MELTEQTLISKKIGHALLIIKNSFHKSCQKVLLIVNWLRLLRSILSAFLSHTVAERQQQVIDQVDPWLFIYSKISGKGYF